MNRKEEIKKIWKECFGDPQDYIDMYFSRVYSERDALTLEKGGRIVSSLLLQPYSMLFNRTDVTVGYIAGAATRRNARGNGYMSELDAHRARHRSRARLHGLRPHSGSRLAV